MLRFQRRGLQALCWLVLLLLSATATGEEEAKATGSEAPPASPESAAASGQEGAANETPMTEEMKAAEVARIAREKREKDQEERAEFRSAKAKKEEEELAAYLASISTQEVTYGSIITLWHDITKKMLSATNFKYFHPKSSGQHQVIGVDVEDGYTHWRVAPRSGQRWELVKDVPVKSGDTIRLVSIRTGRNLHSHEGPVSPLTKENEVSTFGEEDGSMDANDNFIVSTGEGLWYFGKSVQLHHAPNGAILTAHNIDWKKMGAMGNYTMGHTEVACLRSKKHDAENIVKEWHARPVAAQHTGFDRYVALFETKEDQHGKYHSINSDPANGPKEISIYCPQNPSVSVSDLDYNLVSEGKCLALNLQGPHFEAALQLDCEPKQKS